MHQTDGHTNDNPTQQLKLEALSDQVTRSLEQVAVAEGTAAKLGRVLHGFLQDEVLPQAQRAADYAVDPTPLLAVVGDVLRLYADALGRPDATHQQHPDSGPVGRAPGAFGRPGWTGICGRCRSGSAC